MFDVGFWEILLILVLALVVLGPERLPQAARSVGYWVGKARRYIEGVKSEVEKEFDSGELKRMLHNQEVQIRELQSKVTNTEDYVDQSYRNMFEDKDDHDSENPDPEAEHPPGPRYEILEEEDDIESLSDQDHASDEEVVSNDESESTSESKAKKNHE
ncbi:MAG: Sec-independent protein translocase protein TatB [Gammaproteobacteria bacterium]